MNAIGQSIVEDLAERMHTDYSIAANKATPLWDNLPPSERRGWIAAAKLALCFEIKEGRGSLV
jgi:hypothetical protein